MDWTSNSLNGAISAARAAIARLDIEDLAPALRRVHASSARILPPPLRRVVGRAIDQDEWLRESSIQYLEGGDRVGRLVLERPPDWESRLDAIEAANQEQSIARIEEGRETRRQAKIESLEREVARLRTQSRLRQTPNEDFDAERNALIERLRVANSSLRNQLEDVRAQAADQTMRGDSLRSELEEADAVIARLRKAASGPTSAPSDEKPVVFGSGDPIGLAKSLDGLVEALARHQADSRRRSSQATAADDRSLAELLVRFRPDHRESLAALADQPRGFLLAIDGWNVAFLMDEAPDHLTRVRVHAAAARYRRLARARVLPIVVWDTRHGTSVVERRSGVDVRFVDSADDELVEIAERGGTEVVVVSSDRDVRERAGRFGALAVWSTAFVDWAAPG